MKFVYVPKAKPTKSYLGVVRDGFRDRRRSRIYRKSIFKEHPYYEDYEALVKGHEEIFSPDASLTQTGKTKKTAKGHYFCWIT
jgi:hypothetical protein